MKFKLFLLPLIFFSSILYAEYVLVKTENGVITDDQKFNPDVWKILDTLQFPQNTNPYYLRANAIKKNEYSNLKKREYLFLKEKINEIEGSAGTIELLYIPNIIMEIFLSRALVLTKDFKKYNIDHETYIEMSEEDNPPHKSFRDLTKRITEERNLHSLYNSIYLLHKPLLDETRSKANSMLAKKIVGKMIEKGMGKFNADKYLSYHPKIKTEASSAIFWVDYETGISRNAEQKDDWVKESHDILIDKISDIESKIYYSNHVGLYRGSQSVVDRIQLNLTETRSPGMNKPLKGPKDDVPLYSASFGNSALAGCFFDKYACAYFYFLLPQTKTSYILSLPKDRFLEKKSIYYIPSLPLTLGLLSRGEIFHARTKFPLKRYFKKIKEFNERFRSKTSESNEKKSYLDYEYETAGIIFHLDFEFYYYLSSELTMDEIHEIFIKDFFSSSTEFLKVSNEKINKVFFLEKNYKEVLKKNLYNLEFPKK